MWALCNKQGSQTVKFPPFFASSRESVDFSVETFLLISHYLPSLLPACPAIFCPQQHIRSSTQYNSSSWRAQIQAKNLALYFLVRTSCKKVYNSPVDKQNWCWRNAFSQTIRFGSLYNGVIIWAKNAMNGMHCHVTWSISESLLCRIWSLIHSLETWN